MCVYNTSTSPLECEHCYFIIFPGYSIGLVTSDKNNQWLLKSFSFIHFRNNYINSQVRQILIPSDPPGKPNTAATLAYFQVIRLFHIVIEWHLISTWRRRWHLTPVLLPGKSYGQRRLVGCSPWGRTESNTTERLHFPFSLSCIVEGNGNPLQCSCLENPRDGGAGWAAVYGVAESDTTEAT